MMARTLLVSLALVLVSVVSVQGATYSYQFTGAMTSVPSELSGALAVGDSFSGKITFDSSVADSAPEAQIGRYTYAISVFDLTVGSLQLHQTPAIGGDIEVTNGLTDGYIATSIATDPAFSSGSLILESLQFSDATGTAFNDTTAPTTLDLSMFGVRDLTLDFPTGVRAIGRVDRLFVPEPTCVAPLLLAGVVSLRQWRRNR